MYNRCSPALPLSLLQVCRQVYNEAALLPFHCNTFECNNRTTLEVFVSKLTQFQLTGLTSLTITDPLPFDDLRFATQFTGLKALTIYAGASQDIFYNTRQKERFIRGLTTPFAGSPLSRVTACIFQDFVVNRHPLPHQPAQTRPDIYGPVATEIERIILENASKGARVPTNALMQE